MIHIPEPCHEDWTKMTPAQKGRFCKSCKKVVIDFRGKSKTEIESEIKARERKGEQTCGRFTKSQLGVPNAIRERNQKHVSLRWLSHFAAACVLVFGATLFTGCTEVRGDQMDISQMQSPANPDTANSLEAGKMTNLDTGLTVTGDTTLSPIVCEPSEEILIGDVAVEEELQTPGTIQEDTQQNQEIGVEDQEIIMGGLIPDFEPSPPDPKEVLGNVRRD